MRRCRKMISVIMLMVMLVSLLPSGAMAAEAPTGATNEVAAVEEPTGVEPATGETEETLPAETKTDGTENEGDNETTITEGTSEGASVSDGTEATGEATDGGTNEAASVEEPSNGENSSEAATDAAGIGMTSYEIAPVVEPVEKEAKAADDTDRGDLFEYVRGKGGKVRLFVHKNGVEVKKDEDGHYIVNPKNNPYRLIIRTSAKGYEPGVYTYQLPEEFEYIPADGVIKDGELVIGTFEVFGDGLLKAIFNENANGSQDVTASMGFNLNFGGENKKVYPIDNISVIIEKDITGVPQVSKKNSSLDSTSKRFTWSISVTCDEDANAVGLTVIDNVGNQKDDKKTLITETDKEKGIEVSASIGGTVKAKWILKTGSNGFNWRSNSTWGNYGWDYTIPEKAPENASVGAGTAFGKDWDFTFKCYTTRLIEPSNAVGSKTVYANRVWIYDKDEYIDYAKGTKTFYGPGVGYGITKNASWSGEDNQYEYMNWTFTGTISDLVETDVFNFSDRLIISSVAQNADSDDKTTINHADVPEWEDVVGTLSFTDSDGNSKTETVYFEGEGPVSESGFYLVKQDDTYNGDKLLRIYVRNKNREASSQTGTGINGVEC